MLLDERAAAPAPSAATPLFTMKRLRAGATRRLSLFEPRWLAMMDAVAAENGGDMSARIWVPHVANRCYRGAPPLVTARTRSGAPT